MCLPWPSCLLFLHQGIHYPAHSSLFKPLVCKLKVILHLFSRKLSGPYNRAMNPFSNRTNCKCIRTWVGGGVAVPRKITNFWILIFIAKLTWWPTEIGWMLPLLSSERRSPLACYMTHEPASINLRIREVINFLSLVGIHKHVSE